MKIILTLLAERNSRPHWVYGSIYQIHLHIWTVTFFLKLVKSHTVVSDLWARSKKSSYFDSLGIFFHTYLTHSFWLHWSIFPFRLLLCGALGFSCRHTGPCLVVPTLTCQTQVKAAVWHQQPQRQRWPWGPCSTPCRHPTPAWPHRPPVCVYSPHQGNLASLPLTGPVLVMWNVSDCVPVCVWVIKGGVGEKKERKWKNVLKHRWPAWQLDLPDMIKDYSLVLMEEAWELKQKASAVSLGFYFIYFL